MSDDKNLSKELSNFFDTAMRKVYIKGPYVSRVKVNESRYNQCGVTPHFSTGQNLLKKKYSEKVNIGKNH